MSSIEHYCPPLCLIKCQKMRYATFKKLGIDLKKKHIQILPNGSRSMQITILDPQHECKCLAAQEIGIQYCKLSCKQKNIFY